MNEVNSTNEVLDFANERNQGLPKNLKILTILSFIGCGLSYLFLAIMPFLNNMMLKFMDKASSSSTELTPKQLNDLEKSKAMLELSRANLVPLMIISFVATTLCLVGVLWMRKLKKDGFWIYSAGEILPVAGNFIFLGTAQYDGVTSIAMGLIIPFLFIYLYSTQRKFMIN